MAQEPGELRDDIEETRAQMSQTVDAIQERLSPSYLRDEIKEAVRETTVDARDRVQEAVMQTSQQAREGFMSMIRENPIPAAAAGASLAWLFMSARRSSSSSSRNGSNGANGSSRYDHQRAESWRTSNFDRDGETDSEGVTNRVQEMGADVTERAQQMGAGIQQQATEARDMASEKMYRMRGRFQQMLDENPLALGAAAMAAGAVAGMMIPETRRENELMGEARQALGETVQERVQEVAQQAEQVMDRMQDQSGETPQPGLGTGASSRSGTGGGSAGRAGESSSSASSRGAGSQSADTPMGSQAGDLSQTAGGPQGSQPRRPA